MQRLGAKNVHVVVNGNHGQDSIFARALQATDGVTISAFSGNHPAGLVSTHIEKLAPILDLGHLVWYSTAADVVAIGQYLTSGTFPVERVVALSGSALSETGYIKAPVGCPVQNLIGDRLRDGENRLISGDVLTGQTVSLNESIGLYHSGLTVIPEGRAERFLGWLSPGFGLPTWSRAYLSAFIPGKTFAQHTNLNGEHRALVKTGDYRKVCSLDILPEQLIKAILSEDIEMMEQLGILEVAPEDLALCSYICPSKTEFTEIIQAGLDLMQAELN